MATTKIPVDQWPGSFVPVQHEMADNIDANATAVAARVLKADVPLLASDYIAADGVADDTVGLQSFFDDLKAQKRVGVLPEGIINVSGLVSFTQINGWRISGQAPGLLDTGPRTVIRWTGAAGGTMLLLQGVRNGVMENVVIDGAGIAAIGLDYDAVSGGVVSTMNRFESVYVERCTGRGVPIGKSNFQTDQTDWYSCVFRANGEGVSIEDANAVWHNFYGCEWHNNDIGITAAARGTGGHYDLHGGRFTGQKIHDAQVFPGRATVFTGVKSEGSHRFLEGPVSSSASAWPVTLLGCDVNGITAADQQGIRWQSVSPLLIRGGRYRSGQTNLPFKVRAPSSGGTLIGTIDARGVAFPEGNPWNVPGNVGTIIRAEHCTYIDTATTDSIPSVSGYLPRLTPAGASTLTTDPTTAPSSEKATRHWVHIPSATAFAAGENHYFVKSSLCKGKTAVSIVAWHRHGGTAAADKLLGVTAYDDHAVNANTARLIFRSSAAFTSNDKIIVCVQYEPEPVTY